MAVLRHELNEDRTQFVMDLFSDPRKFQEVVLDHPRTFARAMGWCRWGEDLVWEAANDFTAAAEAALRQASEGVEPEVMLDLPSIEKRLPTIEELESRPGAERRPPEEQIGRIPSFEEIDSTPPSGGGRGGSGGGRGGGGRDAGASGGQRGGGGGGGPDVLADDSGKPPKVTIVVKEKTGSVKFKGFPPEIEVEVPWDKILEGLERAVHTSKKSEIQEAMLDTWQAVAHYKDVLLAWLLGEDLNQDDPGWMGKVWNFFLGESTAPTLTPEKMKEFKRTFYNRLVQIQNEMRNAQQSMKNGDKDTAKAHLDNVKSLLKSLREWIAAQK